MKFLNETVTLTGDNILSQNLAMKFYTSSAFNK